MLIIGEVGEKIERIARKRGLEKDIYFKEIFEELALSLKNDRETGNHPGLIAFSTVSEKTADLFEKVKKLCEQKYGFSV